MSHPDVSSLRASVHAYRSAVICGQTLARQWRTELAQVSLPGRFRPVLEQLLSSAESAASFTMEACGFSHTDVCDNLASWLDAYERRVLTAELA